MQLHAERAQFAAEAVKVVETALEEGRCRLAGERSLSSSKLTPRFPTTQALMLTPQSSSCFYSSRSLHCSLFNASFLFSSPLSSFFFPLSHFLSHISSFHNPRQRSSIGLSP